jgi:hypothetical protein
MMLNFINKLFRKKMRDSKLFDKAVAQFFEPIARKLDLPLIKMNDGVYEIQSPYSIMRIRLDTGHRRGLNVLLRPASLREYDENKPGEFGIVNFIEFNGEKLQQTFFDVFTDEDFLRQAQLLAQAAERFGIPYLRGQKNDFEAIGEMIKKRGEPEQEKIREMMRNMPSFVREEWHIPTSDD